MTELVTERLYMRPPVLEDLDSFASFHANATTMEFLGGVQSKHQAWRSLMTIRGSWELEGFGFFSVYLRENDTWIGRIGPWCPAEWPVKEIGWGLHADYVRRGYAHEASVASIDFAFDKLGWEEVSHSIDVKNVGSIKLAERLGSKRAGPVQFPKPFDEMEIDCYAQNKARWQAR